jgi:hypothetical protein
VLRPGGISVAVTNGDEHLADLRRAAGGHAVRTTFSSENGDAALSRHFATVTRVESVVMAGRISRDGGSNREFRRDLESGINPPGVRNQPTRSPESTGPQYQPWPSLCAQAPQGEPYLSAM